ncbi:MAG TPA: hypothetical protein VNG53_07140 [Bacteroidia bacterium]|nr:hypothetical protein [Bacteroidia bacterium]
MKKTIIILLICTLYISVKGQNCLDLNITPLMTNLQVPGDAAQNFAECTVAKNEHQQTVIENYGTDVTQLDTIVNQKTRDFNNAAIANLGDVNSQIPSQQSVQSAQQLAAQLQKMTPDQQKQWAMQQATKQNYSAASTIQDDPTTTKLVLETTDMASRQLKLLNDEFAAKFRQITFAKTDEINAVKQPDMSNCPTIDKVGTPSCACVDGREGTYWEQIVTIQNKYNQQLIALMQTYIPKLKTLESSVDDNIAKLKYGDIIKTASLKKQLFSAQTSAFANAFLVTVVCIKEIRKSGSDAYVNKVNCDNLVYDLACGK